MTEIKYSGKFDFWFRTFGITIIEQCNVGSDCISFHSWKSEDELLETGTGSTVAMWIVKTKTPLQRGLNNKVNF